jgi:hypothetical protein
VDRRTQGLVRLGRPDRLRELEHRQVARVSEVEEDLAAVAATWPFLQMRVQLVDNEGEGDLCGEWAVTGGKAMEVEPGGLIVAPEFDTDAAVLGLVFGHGRERGVSPERLASAYARIRTAQP